MSQLNQYKSSRDVKQEPKLEFKPEKSDEKKQESESEPEKLVIVVGFDFQSKDVVASTGLIIFGVGIYVGKGKIGKVRTSFFG